MTDGEGATPAKVGIGQAAILTAIVVIALVGFLALGQALRMAPVYAGLLFFWYWISVDKGDAKPMPAAILGAIGGSVHAWLLQWSAHHHNMLGLVLFALWLIVAIFLQIAVIVPILINACYMLFLTVLCAPLLQDGEDFGVVLLSIFAGIAYFGAFVFAAKRLLALQQARKLR